VAKTYEAIASQTLGSATATVSFDNIPGTYTDLVLVAWMLGASGGAGVRLRLNDDSGNNYSTTYLHGNGSSAASNRESSQPVLAISWNSNTDSTGNMWIGQFMSHANTNVYKTLLGQQSKAGTSVDRTVGLWRSTSAITKITLAIGGSFPNYNFSSGSTFALYGIKAA